MNIIVLGKIRVAGQLRQIKCQTVLEADPLILSMYVCPSQTPLGLPTTHWINHKSLWALELQPPCKLFSSWSICRTSQGQSLEDKTRFLTSNWDSSCLNWEMYGVSTYTWGSHSKIPSQLMGNASFQGPAKRELRKTVLDNLESGKSYLSLNPYVMKYYRCLPLKQENVRSKWNGKKVKN